MKPLPKLILIGLVLGGVYTGLNWARNKGMIPGMKMVASSVPNQAVLPEAPNATLTSVPAVSLPSNDPAPLAGPQIRFEIWAWNAQMGMLFANGGPTTTRGSLMEKHKVNVNFTRQDDVAKMQADLLAFAQELHDGNPQPQKGVHFVAIMGDGAASFFAGLNPQLEKLGPEYRAKVIGSAGYSRGEDKFMGLPEWKQNPQSARGGLVAGYLRDGDWNIAMKWLADNGIPNNPDEKTYDPNALNWVAADTYIDASEKYVAGYCEERPVVANGKRTGERKKVCVNGVVTWTPGDVIVAEKRGGLVSIVSTKEYASQMPNVIIGIDKWMKDNRRSVEGMLAAILEGGDQVMHHERALRRGAEISNEVYKEQNTTPEYWVKYFRGVTETDRQGMSVELGGSKVNNLADNMLLFGNSGLFAATYNTFGGIVKQQYPDLVPSFPPVTEVLDASYLNSVAARSEKSGRAEVAKFDSSSAIKDVVGRRAYHIQFRTGEATFTEEAKRTLDELYNQLAIASSLVIVVHGHTDSVGNPDSNMRLSERRAFAVKELLESRSSTLFPSGRVRVFAHGQTNPVAPNDTPEGRAQNRRVEIVLGTTN
jgi:outer membrane protein OmpA-like peptidoglycan-associated protein